VDQSAPASGALADGEQQDNSELLNEKSPSYFYDCDLDLHSAVAHCEFPRFREELIQSQGVEFSSWRCGLLCRSNFPR
jgi:hypothetical protein